MPPTPLSEGLRTGQTQWMPPLPIIGEDEPLSEVVHQLSQIAKWHFSNVGNDDRRLFQTRGFACEIVAWRILYQLTKHELIEYLLREIPPAVSISRSSSEGGAPASRPSSARIASNDPLNERSRLLFEGRTFAKPRTRIQEPQEHQELLDSHAWRRTTSESVDEDPTVSFVGLNALEIATVAGAKRFLSQGVVQDVVNGIWSGDIIFWESLTLHTRKRAQLYNQRYGNHVLVERNPRHITVVEILLYTWITAFACDEFGEFKDAGTLFYAADFWSFWDIGIIGIGIAFLVSSMSALTHVSHAWKTQTGSCCLHPYRPLCDCTFKGSVLTRDWSTLGIIGLARHSDHIIDVSFDILSLEALFLVPRVCALLSINSYFGTLVGSFSTLEDA
ncbi:MAG: hypothetical protein Q9207_001983 [Kuettlingeria erythrocarpa]